MRTLSAFLLLVLGSCLLAAAAPVDDSLTVQDALKLLTRDQQKNLVRIEARDGTPAPDRWYFLVYDATVDNGLREIVVWKKTVVANRTLSQFLDAAAPVDVVGSKAVRVDSDDLIRTAQQYVEANNLDVTHINYTMFKDADNPSPVWKLTCFDDSGKQLAELVVNARNASVVSHEGFDIVPGQDAKPAIPVAVASPSPGSQPQPANPASSSTPVPVARPPVAVAVAAGPGPSPGASPKPGATPAAAAATPTPKRGLFQKIFGSNPKSTPTPNPRSH